MKCYYEELGVDQQASESAIKTAYRKLALKWHPDKNPNCIEDAKARFLLIQQAYEVLSDPQEKAWYDSHREQILRGKNSEYVDNCLDVFQYFTASCYKGYGDEEGGFYAVYQEVFKKIATEDEEFRSYADELVNVPEFGNSNSDYETVVGPFYAYWSAYCTKRTYTWLCPYDVREIKDRKVFREIQKDMKKVVQKAKKERNEEVRNLVSYVRKRDRRVLAYRNVLEKRAALNRKKQEQNRIEQIRRRQKELHDMRQSNHSNDDYEEKLKILEQQYSSDDEEFDEQRDFEAPHYDADLYCVACSKDFKTKNAFANHEISKKHLDNIDRLKMEMKNEEHIYHQIEKSEDEDDISILEIGEIFDLKTNKNSSSKTKRKKSTKKQKQLVLSNFCEDVIEENVGEVTEELVLLDDSEKEDAEWYTLKKSSRKSNNKNKTIQCNSILLEHQPIRPKAESKSEDISSCDLGSKITQHICVTCKSRFESKNKLFSHLQLTNHSVFIPKTNEMNNVSIKSKNSKGKNKK